MASQLKRVILEAVLDTLGDSILLSGGLDTSIIAASVSTLVPLEQIKEDFHAYTVVLEGSPAPDFVFSQIVAKKFGIPHHVCRVTFRDIEDCLPEVIRVLRSFDPMEVRNSIAVFLGLREAKMGGFHKIMTGDASDELFAGYSFVYNLQPEMARATLRHLWNVMHFSSIPLAASLGIEARLPFLHKKVTGFAKLLDFDCLVGEREGEIFGKHLLRKAFADLLPAEIVWCKKAPIEVGSGTSALPPVYSEMIKDEEFVEKKRRYLERDGVKIRDKEQLRYYEVYRGNFGPPPEPDRSRKVCPGCSSNIADGVVFCTTCGEYPI